MSAQNPYRYVLFLDRDGTLNEEVNYLSDPANLRLLPGVPEAIRCFNAAGWAVVVVTNQSGIGRGYFTAEDVAAVNAALMAALEAQGAHVDAIYVCPHHPDAQCACRKPKPVLFQQALADLRLEHAPCVAVGDKMSDLEPGRALGCRTILVQTGYGAALAAHPETLPFMPDAILPDLAAVAVYLLGMSTD